MKVLFLIFIFASFILISCSAPNGNVKVDSVKFEHFILGEWKSEVGNFFMIFQTDNTVKILLKKENKIIEENTYNFKIIDENTVEIAYVKPLQIRKINDKFHIKTNCNKPMIDPPILCFENKSFVNKSSNFSKIYWNTFLFSSGINSLKGRYRKGK